MGAIGIMSPIVEIRAKVGLAADSERQRTSADGALAQEVEDDHVCRVPLTPAPGEVMGSTRWAMVE